MTTSLSAATPVEIDTYLSANYGQQVKLESRIASEVKHLDYLKRLRQPELDQVEKTSARITKYQDQLHDLIAESAPYLAEYNSRPWNRYFLVTNGNGHVHRGMNCPTCFPTTSYAWLVELADCDENAMIEEWGERACTVCFPSAPTNPLYHRPAKVDREERERREAEKAEREAQKAAKNLTRDEYFEGLHDQVRTVAAAKQELRDAAKELAGCGWDIYKDKAPKVRENARRVLLGRGMTEAELDKLETTAVKRGRKEQAEAQAYWESKGFPTH